jgi:hypothetical protein
MIGVDPHKASHTAVAISAAEEPVGQLRVRASAVQAERLLGWARAWPERAWAVEGAGGIGHLLAQQLLAAGERVLDVPPKLAARVRLLATGDVNKNDPNDARSREAELASLIAVAKASATTRRFSSAIGTLGGSGTGSGRSRRGADDVASAAAATSAQPLSRGDSVLALLASQSLTR